MADNISLKDYFDTILAEHDVRYQQRFDAQQQAVKDALLSQEKAVQAALTAAKEAVTKAETAAEKRFDSVNEFRKTLTDQTATFIPRLEAQIKFDSMAKEIDDLKTSRDNSTGRSSGFDKSWIVFIGLAMMVIAIISVIFVATKH